MSMLPGPAAGIFKAEQLVEILDQLDAENLTTLEFI